MPKTRITPGIRYLAGWKGIPGTDRRALDPLDEAGTSHKSMVNLTELGYIVSINGAKGHYYVRCIPLRSTPYRVGQGVTLVYNGADMEYILSCAAYEADLLIVDPNDAILSDEECTRWAHR